MNWLLDAEPRPAILVLPPAAASLDEAEAAIELWEHYTSKRADATQKLVVQVMMAQAADGSWAAQSTGREMPRQNGKGDELEIVELWGLCQRGEAILHTIHDAVLLASQTQQRMLGVLESHVDLRRKIKRTWKGTGQQMIEMTNGGVIWYRTRTGGGGRGVDDIDRLVIDEAQHATDEQLAAMTPTLFANRNPQMNIVGTAGLEGKSEWWWNIRKRALSDDPGNFGYVGHTAENVSLKDGRVVQEFPDVNDRSTWLASNPALHAGRGRGMDFLEEQVRNLGERMFAQEHLCVWAPEPDAGHAVIPLDRWNDLIDATVDEDHIQSGTVRLALDAPPSRASASFSVAAKLANGLLYVERRDHLPPTRMPDLVVRAKELCELHGTSLVMPHGSPALSWKPSLEAAGVQVDVLSQQEFGAAFGYVQAQVAEGTIRHRGQPEVTNAIAGLGVKPSGDVDVPTRRTSTADVSPFMAICAAVARVPESSPKKGLFLAVT